MEMAQRGWALGIPGTRLHRPSRIWAHRHFSEAGFWPHVCCVWKLLHFAGCVLGVGRGWCEAGPLGLAGRGGSDWRCMYHDVRPSLGVIPLHTLRAWLDRGFYQSSGLLRFLYGKPCHHACVMAKFCLLKRMIYLGFFCELWSMLLLSFLLLKQLTL